MPGRATATGRMARSKPNDRTGRLFRHPSGQDELFDKSYEEELEARRGEPVECLGLTFENDEARRSHFLGSLREGAGGAARQARRRPLRGSRRHGRADGGNRALAHGRGSATSPPRRAHAPWPSVKGPAPALEGRGRLSPRRNRGHPESLRSALAHRLPKPLPGCVRGSLRQARRSR